jgi:hypothetical protein
LAAVPPIVQEQTAFVGFLICLPRLDSIAGVRIFSIAHRFIPEF